MSTDHPAGLVRVNETTLDHNPGQVARDAVRTARLFAAWLGEEPDAEDAAALETADAVVDGLFAYAAATASKVSYTTARAARDVIRCRLLDRLRAAFVPARDDPPYFAGAVVADEDAAAPARSRLVDKLDVQFVAPVDRTAAIVAGHDLAPAEGSGE